MKTYGKNMASIRDVARQAGVSTSTVSIVLNNGEKYVSDNKRVKILNAADQLGYTLPPKKRFDKKTIAVILPVVASSFFSNVLSGIEEAISPDNTLLLFYNSNYDLEKEKACLRTLKKQNLEGIIIDSVCPLDQEKEYFQMLKTEFIEKNIPIVMLERNCQKYNLHSVYVNNFQSAYNATQYLIENGHRRIAHIMGNQKMPLSKERFDGYRAALSDYQIAYDPELVHAGDFTPYSGYISLKELLNLGVPFTAIFSANDQMAIGAMKALLNSGWKVPDDVCIVGFDNLSVSSLINPALTTIHVPTYQMGRIAAKIILETTATKNATQNKQLNTTLVIRRSSDETATNEWELFGW